MINTEMVLQMVRANQVPPQWRILRARQSYYVWSALGYAALALGAIAAAVFIVLSGTVVGYGVNDQTPQNILQFWFYADLVVLAFLLIGGIVMAIRRVLALGSVDEQMLVLLPEGFIMRKGMGAKDTVTINYENVGTISRKVKSGTTYAVLKSSRDSRVVNLPLDARYGPPKKVFEQIQNAHAQYATMRLRAGR